MMPITPAPLLSLFSTEDMPHSFNPILQDERRWFDTDTENKYQKNPHPKLKPEDVFYRFNAYGFRCPEFVGKQSNERVLSVLSLGASEVMGTGIPEDKTFSKLFTKLLEKHVECSVIDWNLGFRSKSADYMSRILVSALPILKPDIVLLVFPFPGRREHINIDGKVFSYNSVADKSKLAERFANPEQNNQFQAHSALSSDYNDKINFFKNYQVCEALCEKHNTMWLFSSYRDSFFSEIMGLVKIQQFVTPGIGDLKAKYQNEPEIGLARDMQHPGLMPHQILAEQFFDKLKLLYFDRLELF